MLTVFTVGQKYKKIGILGGMGPEATAELYLKIIKIFQDKFGAKYDSDYPEIMIYNLPLPDVVEKIDQSSKIKEMLVKGVQKLESWGVDFIAIPCNTVNFFLPEMRTAVSIPILSILEETAKEVNKLELKPFLEYDHNYTSEDQKGKGRIRIADGSRNLIKSVLDDLGT